MKAGREARTSCIRALERDDLPGVCALFEQVLGSGERAPNPRLAGYFERIFFDDPWADTAISPLVYEAPGGEVVGFIGVNARRLRLDGRRIQMAVTSNLAAHPEWRSRGVGALLLRRVLAGPQDLTVADQANDGSRELWLGLGGQELVNASVGWYRILRPGSAVSGLLDLQGRRGVLRDVARGAGPAVDTIARRLPRLRALEPVEPDGIVEPLTSDGLLQQMSAAGGHLRLYPDYDSKYLRWVFAQLDALRSEGEVVARLVRGARGQVLGWFLYLLPDRGVAKVLQVGVPGNGRDVVLDHLFRQAWSDGAAAVRGRLEPATSGVLGRTGVVVRRSARALVHSQDPTVLALLGSTKSLLSHIDGEWIVSHARRL